MSIAKLVPVYGGPTNPTERAVHDALAAYHAGLVSPVLELGLRYLAAAYEQRSDLPDIERAERYVAECWAEVGGGK